MTNETNETNELETVPTLPKGLISAPFGDVIGFLMATVIEAVDDGEIESLAELGGAFMIRFRFEDQPTDHVFHLGVSAES